MPSEIVRYGVPDAPWRLLGFGAQTFRLVDVEVARSVTPPHLRIVHVWPGKTLASLYFASYGIGSTLVYHELVVAAALVTHNRRIAAWIPKIYVDDERSLRGGREIWALPKELAKFEIREASGAPLIVVTRFGRELCRFRFFAKSSSVRIVAPLPALGLRHDAAAFFTGWLHASAALANFQLEVEPGSYLEPFGLEHPLFSVMYGGLDLRVPAPVEQRTFSSAL